MRNLKILLFILISILFFTLGLSLRAFSFELNESKFHFYIPFTTYHFKNNNKFNNVNYGLLVFYGDKYQFGVGIFRNSLYRNSLFVGGGINLNSRLSLFYGLANNYRNKIKIKTLKYKIEYEDGYMLYYRNKKENLNVPKFLHITDDIIYLIGIKIRVIKNLNLVITPKTMSLFFEF